MIKAYDIAVIGGSLGGVTAAYSAAAAGKSVVLTEETDFIGGQLTSQAVPPDEHKWIETTGCTQTYRRYRDKVRDYYRAHPYIIDELKTKEYFCPGGSSVSRLSHEPLLAHRLLNEMLKPFTDSGLITVLLNHKPVAAKAAGDEISGVTVLGADGIKKDIKAHFYLDATDTGELIKLCGCEYTAGAESRLITGEPHAPERGDSGDMQPVTWVGAVEYDKDKDIPMEKPAEYGYFKRLMQPYDKYPVLSWYGPDSSTSKAKRFGMFNGETAGGQALFGLFTYRRIIAAHHFKDGFYKNDVTLINWPQNDYFMGNIFDTDDDEYNKYMAKQLTLSLIYWLKTEAETAGGQKGYRGINLRGDVLGTADGLAKSPYIRESRRIVSDFTLTEQLIGKKFVKAPPDFADSVGVGSYHIDLHITTKTHTFFYDEAWPFQIPLSAMIPVRIKNLIPSCKNIAATHLTNGCYRLHPIEWNIGEAAGYLAAYCIENGVSPRDVSKSAAQFSKFKERLISAGIQTRWSF